MKYNKFNSSKIQKNDNEFSNIDNYIKIKIKFNIRII